MEHEQRIKVESLLGIIRDQGIYSDSELVELLGASRNSLLLADLEKALMRSGRIRPNRLSQLKAESAGMDMPPEGCEAIAEAMPKEVARATGALVLSLEPLLVGVVEDTEKAVRSLEAGLGRPYRMVPLRLDEFQKLYRRAYEGESSKELAPLSDIYQVFDLMEASGGSDLHLSVGYRPAVRVDGSLQELPVESPDTDWMRGEIVRIAGARRAAQAEQEYNLDLAFAFGESRYRINVGADQRGPTIAARKIPGIVPTMEALGLPAAVKKLVDLPRGLVLVTGPTGSGKSTTLAALLQHIAQEHPKHIITLEDPVEFPIKPGQSTVHQRELGGSFTTFADGLRQALRQDPDVVLVGEMRDLETMRTALTAAETGHLVFGTLHTYDAASTVARIVSSFPAEEQAQVRGLLSHILKAIVSQTLLPLAQGRGRAAGFEILISNPAISANLRKVDGQAQIRQTMEVSTREGMQTMDMALADLVRRRIVTLEAAMLKASDPEDLMRRIEK